LTTDKPGGPAGTKRGSRLTATLCVDRRHALGGFGRGGDVSAGVAHYPHFLLLAAICLCARLATVLPLVAPNRWCGAYIRNYREGRGVTLRHKLVVCSF
jgi:hypothetical protein